MLQLIAAINEIKAQADSPLRLEAIRLWLSKHEPLEREYPCPPQDYSDVTIKEFLMVQGLLYDYIKLVDLDESCKAALAEYKVLIQVNPSTKNNPELKDWVMRHYDLDWELFDPTFKSADVNYVFTQYGTTYAIPIEHVENVAIFHEIYKRLYYEDLLYPEMIAANEARRQQWVEEQSNGIPKTNNPHLLCDECKDFGFCQKNTPEYYAPPYVYNFKCKFDSEYQN